MRAEIKKTVTRFLANFGLPTAKVDALYEKTSGAGILLGDLFRLPNSGYQNTALSGNLTLDADSAPVQIRDPDGTNRDVTLPAGTAGMWFLIVNMANAAENLVVKAAGGTPTVITVNQNEAALVVHNGTAWAYAGVITIAIT